MAEDQEWCLECGTARTLIHSPPDWRIPLAMMATVAALIVLAFLIALVNLSGDAGNAGAGAGAGAGAASTTATTATTARPVPQTRVAAWPIGLPGWTVQLASYPTRAAANAQARALARTNLSVGVLRTDQHPAMVPGQFVVFSGRYPNRQQAAARASVLKAAGQPGAQAVLVGHPGQP